MSHGKNVKAERDNATHYKERLGIYMFFMYTLIYGGFVVINVVNPDIMGIPLFFGLNLAIIYGFGLIILAVVSGLIYNHLCTSAENRLNAVGGGQK